MFQSICLASLGGKPIFIDSIKKNNSKYDSVLRLNIISNKKTV